MDFILNIWLTTNTLKPDFCRLKEAFMAEFTG